MRNNILKPKSKLNKYLKLILFTFLFTTFSGALRKWGTNSSVVSNALLAVQLIMPMSFLLMKGALSFDNRHRTMFNVLLSYLIVLILMAFNPLNLTVYHGILGFALHAGFWVGIIIYLKKREEINLEELIPFFIVITIGMFVLASIQSASPAESFINKYAADENEGMPDAFVGDAVRVTGTFSYLSGYSAYLFFAVMLCCTLIKLEYNRGFTLSLIIATFYGCLLSGSRGSTFFFILCIPMFILTAVNIKNNSKLLATFIGLYLMVSLLGFVLGDTFPILSSINKSYENFSTRTEDSEETNSRFESPFEEILNYNGPSPIFGLGLGATYQGAVKMFGYNPKLWGVAYEGEPKRIILEGGFLLFFIRILLFYFLFTQLKLPWMFKGFLLGIVFFGVSLVFNIYTSYYALVGIMLLDRAFTLKQSPNNVEQ